jgi:hypothetical protein
MIKIEPLSYWIHKDGGRYQVVNCGVIKDMNSRQWHASVNYLAMAPQPGEDPNLVHTRYRINFLDSFTPE